MGSDYPAQIRDDDPVKRIRAVGLSGEEEDGVLGLNATKLLGIQTIEDFE
jgi:predicted TIM-barrel fold metal-dependent hydrolase